MSARSSNHRGNHRAVAVSRSRCFLRDNPLLRFVLGRWSWNREPYPLNASSRRLDHLGARFLPAHRSSKSIAGFIVARNARSTERSFFPFDRTRIEYRFVSLAIDLFPQRAGFRKTRRIPRVCSRKSMIRIAAAESALRAILRSLDKREKDNLTNRKIEIAAPFSVCKILYPRW